MAEVEGEGGEQVDAAGAESSHGGNVVWVAGDGDAGVGAEDSDGDSMAEVGVEGLAGAMVVGGRVLGGFEVDATAKGFGLADVVERSRASWDDCR
jgi:hypothetical protein